MNMRKDQIFVLMLVVLLPLTGCFDGGGIGEAEGAQDSSNSVQENNEILYSVHIESDSSHSVTLNGTTLKMESGYWQGSEDWRPIGGVFKVYYSIDCSDGYQIKKLWAFAGDTIPVKGGIECIVEIFPHNSNIALIYSEAVLLPLQ